MERGPLAFVALLTVVLLLDCRPSQSATAAVDLAAAEGAVRKADADWSTAASTASVEAWMAFYATDAVLLLPNEQLASGQELLRHTVTRLLALPHVSIVWRPSKVEMARSGDLALLIGPYELRFGDPRGTPISDRGRRLEIWRKQADGTWKCGVDSWILDESIAAAAAARSPGVQGTPPIAGSAAPVAQTAPPPPATPAEFTPQTAARAVATKYGEMPADYKETIRKYFLEHLKYPGSIQYREITTPEQGYTTVVAGGLLMREKREYGWTVKATVNAKNSHDSYVGFKSYTFLFRGEKIVDARLPLPEDEIN